MMRFDHRENGRSLFFMPLKSTPSSIHETDPDAGAMYFYPKNEGMVHLQMTATSKERVALSVTTVKEGEKEEVSLHLTPQVWEFLIATHKRVTNPSKVAPHLDKVGTHWQVYC
jgi:hypothetical protein